MFLVDETTGIEALDYIDLILGTKMSEILLKEGSLPLKTLRLFLMKQQYFITSS